jgi:hypothetical protein
MNNEFGKPCHFCETGLISLRFIKEGSGACRRCINRVPVCTHIEDRYNFLIADLKFKGEIDDKTKEDDTLDNN